MWDPAAIGGDQQRVSRMEEAGVEMVVGAGVEVMAPVVVQVVVSVGAAEEVVVAAVYSRISGGGFLWRWLSSGLWNAVVEDESL